MIKIQDLKIYLNGDIDKDIEFMLRRYIKSERELSGQKNKYKKLEISNFKIEGIFNITNNILEKQDCHYHIYKVSPDTFGIEMVLEILKSSYENPKGTIIFVKKTNNGKTFTRETYESIKKLINDSNNICERINACLNDIYAILDLIFDITIEEIMSARFSTHSKIIDELYEMINLKKPSDIYINQTKIQNIGRVLNKLLDNNEFNRT